MNTITQSMKNVDIERIVNGMKRLRITASPMTTYTIARNEQELTTKLAPYLQTKVSVIQGVTGGEDMNDLSEEEKKAALKEINEKLTPIANEEVEVCVGTIPISDIDVELDYETMKTLLFMLTEG